ncbi:MAG TPA: hypothetical protein VKT78_01435 [Fimbriimonadaceae bacterium]|nr:hypothetical protein [Fimbriimonadaceae bacterium]
MVRAAHALLLPIAVVAVGGLWSGRSVHEPSTPSWSPGKAATYLDSRTRSWMSGGAMDHGTFCISCHTALPYALARPTMGSALGESAAPEVERQLLASITTRVRQWSQIQPYLGDKRGGPGTESVLNALILARADAHTGRLSETSAEALRIMWSQQSQSGAWPWINAGNEPWEAPDSEYWGATLAAVATGTAPEGYLGKPAIQAGLGRLKAYLKTGEAGNSLLNRLALLWAASKVPGLIAPDRRAAIVADVLAKQQADGGWSTASLIPGTWTRHDRTAQDGRSDGYGTGIVAFVLIRAGVGADSSEIRKARSWLARNQDHATGAWPTVSPNAKRDGSTDVGKFMTDAATAYAVLALSG